MIYYGKFPQLYGYKLIWNYEKYQVCFRGLHLERKCKKVSSSSDVKYCSSDSDTVTEPASPHAHSPESPNPSQPSQSPKSSDTFAFDHNQDSQSLLVWCFIVYLTFYIKIDGISTSTYYPTFLEINLHLFCKIYQQRWLFIFWN